MFDLDPILSVYKLTHVIIGDYLTNLSRACIILSRTFTNYH